MARPDARDEPIPGLLRAARGAYSAAINRRLGAEGIDDLPRNGPFVLGSLARWSASLADVIEGLGVTKQAASQLIDTLVLRGYLTREVNAEDRRRMTIELTDRGRAAASAVRAAIEGVDAELATMVTTAELDGLRSGLAALARLKGRPDVEP